METFDSVHPSECVLWAACQYIAEKVDNCPGCLLDEPCSAKPCMETYPLCWVLHFQKLVS